MGSFGLLNSFMSFWPNFYMLYITFFFINLSQPKTKKRQLRLYLSFLASISYIIYVLAFVGRDGIVLWSMSFLILAVFFKRFISKENKILIKKIFVFMLVVGIIPFILITISRFANREDAESVWIIYYIGQSSLVFNDDYIIGIPVSYGAKTFPLFYNYFHSIGLIDFNAWFLECCITKKKDSTSYRHIEMVG